MRDEINPGRRRLVNLLQHLLPALGHHHQPRRARNQLLHHPPLLGAGFAQNGVQRGHDRHPQLAQQGQERAAGRPAVAAELVLHADDVRIAHVQEIRRALVSGQVLPLDLETNLAGILLRRRQVLSLPVG